MNIPVWVVVIVAAVVVVVYLFTYSLCVVSGRCSRAEELRAMKGEPK